MAHDIIRAQARRAVEADQRSGRELPECPYVRGSIYSKRWYAAYLEREVELNQSARVKQVEAA